MLTCCFCRPGDEKGNQFPNTSENSVTLYFDSGRAYVVPENLTHYIADHGWNPGANFIADVMNYRIIDEISAPKGTVPRKLGYFTAQTRMDLGGVPDACVWRLKEYIASAVAKAKMPQPEIL